jgi:diguanylate cyclase (GGDEF)-like protein
MAERRKSAESLKLFATVDPMTGVLNRHAGLAYLTELIGGNQPTTVCFTDVNDLKLVNDTYGHHEGDELIRIVAGIFVRNLRKTDLVCRVGGDEFLLIFPGLSLDEAENAWARIAADCKMYNEAGHKEYKVIVSHGKTHYDGSREITVDELVREADCAMYQEKYNYKQAACLVPNPNVLGY